MTIKKQAITAVSSLWLGSLFGSACAFLTQVILARQLSPVQFGIFSTALAMVTILTPLAGFGVAQYWLKVFGAEGWSAQRVFLPSLQFVVISTVFITLVSIGWAIIGPHGRELMRVIAILSFYIIGQVSVELVSSKLQLEERYVFLALWQCLPHLIRLLLVSTLFFLLTSQISVANVAITYAILALGWTLISTRALYKMLHGSLSLKGHSKVNSDLNILNPSVTTVINHSWPFGLAALFHLIYFQSDIILIQYIIGSEMAGIYNVSFTVMVAVLLFPGVIYQKFLLPKIHRWAHHDKTRFYQVYRQGNIIMLIMGLIAMVLIWFIAPWVVSYVFGEGYREAIQLLQILAISAPILFTASSVGATLVTQEYMKTKVKLMGLVAIVNIVLNLILIPSFGAIGAAIATIISNIVLLAIYYFVAQKLVFYENKDSDV